MRSANPPLGIDNGHVGLPQLALSPERVLVAANAISLSRGVAALAILAMSLAGVSPAVLLAAASAMWMTDVLDGVVARIGLRRGALQRTDSAALDPLMDDVAFVSGFLILLEAGAAPLWFVAGLLASRVLFALIRFTGLAHREPFAHPQPVTKLNGAVLAIGQLLLLAHVGFPDSFLGAEGLAAATIATMTATTAYSIYRFAVLKHARTLARLLTP